VENLPNYGKSKRLIEFNLKVFSDFAKERLTSFAELVLTIALAPISRTSERQTKQSREHFSLPSL
jgi:hypothetical protein